MNKNKYHISRKTPKAQYIKGICEILRQFSIIITDEIQLHIEGLYPNEIAIDNYVKFLIKEKLGSD